MLTASGAFDVVMNSLSQTVAGQLTLDLPASPYVDFSRCLRSVQLDCQNQTDLPDGVRDTVGFSTIGGTVVVAGQVDPTDASKTVAWLFNPDETTSPLYRLPMKGVGVTFRFGVKVPGSATAELPPKLTGRVTSLEIDHAAGEVTFGVVDMSADWGALPEIPAVVTAAPFNSGLTSEFPMDAVIRSVNGGVSSWPATRNKCRLAVGFRTSLWPEVGTLSQALTQPNPTFAPGPFGSGLTSLAGGDTGDATYLLAGTWDYGPFIEGWVSGVTGMGLRVQIGVGNLVGSTFTAIDTVTVGGPGVRSALTTAGSLAGISDTDTHYFSLFYTFHATTMDVTGTIDGASFTTTGFAIPAGLQSAGAVSITVNGAVLAGLQITTEQTPPSNYPFTPAAVLDESLNPLTVVPEIAAGTGAWDVLQQIAAAELGYARMDEAGVFRFTNRVTIAGQTVAHPIKSTVSLKSMKTSIGGTTQYDHIQVPFTEWTFGAPTAVFILQSNKRIPKHRTTTWTQPLDDGTLVAAVDTTAALLPNGHDPLDGSTWYRASTDVHGVNPHPGLTITVTQISSGTVRISAANNTGADAYLTTPATYSDLTAGAVGTGLWIGGTPATPAAEQLADVTTGAAASLLTVTSNPYVQDQDTAADVAAWLLNQLHVAIRDFTDVAIVPDARLQIPDLQRLQDFIRAKVDEYAILWGWSFSADFPAAGSDGGSWGQTVNVRALGPPGAWLAGIPGRSEAPTTDWAYA